MNDQATLYYDLGSPYAYLAAARAGRILGFEPRLEPVLVGGIFVLRGHGSWAHTPERPARTTEVEERARRYGLPPLCWPPGWPNNTLAAMRAATWAERLGSGAAFATEAFRRAFAAGEDLSRVEVLAEVADAAGLPGEDLPEAIADPSVKDALRAATDAAWERGVVGVPCLDVGGRIFFGDDRLEAAASSSAPG